MQSDLARGVTAVHTKSLFFGIGGSTRMPRVGFGCDVALGLGVNWTDFLLFFLNSFHWHISFLWRDDMFVIFFLPHLFRAWSFTGWCVLLEGDAEGLDPEEERAYEQASAATWAVIFG